MKYKNKRKKAEEQNFWQSYSDMMAALLLVFVLIIAFSISLTKATYEEKEMELEQQNNEIQAYKLQLEEQQKEIENQQTELENQKIAFDEQQEQLDAIVGIRATVISNLKEEFANTNMNIEIDPETGAISFDSNILFDTSKSDLKPSGIAFLNEFFPKYFEVILSDDVKDYISEIIIEGHTDNRGTYLYNLDLSQKRALSVARYCLGEENGMFSNDDLETVRALVTANGRAYYELKYDENGNVDLDASRRVEIKFRLKEDEMIEEMSSLLEE